MKSLVSLTTQRKCTFQIASTHLPVGPKQLIMVLEDEYLDMELASLVPKLTFCVCKAMDRHMENRPLYVFQALLCVYTRCNTGL